MIHVLVDCEELKWIDVVNPSHQELAQLVEKYGFYSTLVQDCLDPEHLPKFEGLEDTLRFLILRAYDEEAGPDAGSIQDITRKVAVFIGPKLVMTVHRREQSFLTQFFERKFSTPDARAGCIRTDSLSIHLLLAELLLRTIRTYEKPIDEAFASAERFEEAVFSGKQASQIVEELFLLKRKTSAIKRLLYLTREVVFRLTPAAGEFSSKPARQKVATHYQNLKEAADSLYFYCDELLEDINNLLNVHISLSSQKTNEVVRVLTVFSVFFMPLTFIAGVYGMNFRWMPELEWKWGYFATLGVMALVSLMILIWFKKRGWLER